MKIIGLVGMPGSGKSTVASILGENGAATIDCDDVIDHIYKIPYSAQLISEAVAHNHDLLNEEGGIDKPKMANFIFSDPEYMDRLFEYVHPMVIAEVCRRLQVDRDTGKALSIIEGVFLFEAGLNRLCEKVWFVDAMEHIRHQRLKERGWSPSEISRRENNICTTHPYDAKIDNSNTKEELRAAVEIFMDENELRDPRAEVMNLALEHFQKATENRKEVTKLLVKAAEILSREIRDMQGLMKSLTK